MTDDYERLEATVSQALAGAPNPSPEELRQKISGLNFLITGGRVTPDRCEKLAREIETRQAVVSLHIFLQLLDNAHKRASRVLF